MQWQEMPPSGAEGMMPPPNMDIPPHDDIDPISEPPHEEREPISVKQSLVANVLSVITGMFGFR